MVVEEIFLINHQFECITSSCINKDNENIKLFRSLPIDWIHLIMTKYNKKFLMMDNMLFYSLENRLSLICLVSDKFELDLFEKYVEKVENKIIRVINSKFSSITPVSDNL